jgi:hypothetical protein
MLEQEISQKIKASSLEISSSMDSDEEFDGVGGTAKGQRNERVSSNSR